MNYCERCDDVLNDGEHGMCTECKDYVNCVHEYDVVEQCGERANVCSICGHIELI